MIFIKREDLKKNIKDKLLLEGLVSSGKTYIATRVTKLYAIAGKRVQYIDTEFGGDKEREKTWDGLTDDELDRIDLISAPDMDTMLNHMISIEGQYDLKVVDNLSDEIDLYKTKLTRKFIKQGSYEIGGKIFYITDPDIFTLNFSSYAKIYDQLTEALIIMLQQPYDIIAAIHPLKTTDTQQALQERIYQKFDTVYRLEKDVGTGFPVWKGTVVKNRGRENPKKSVAIDSVYDIFKYYAKRLGLDRKEAMKRLEIEEGNK